MLYNLQGRDVYYINSASMQQILLLVKSIKTKYPKATDKICRLL